MGLGYGHRSCRRELLQLKRELRRLQQQQQQTVSQLPLVVRPPINNHTPINNTNESVY